MLSNLFLGMALLGAEWVLYVLVLLSILSVALMIERWKYYKKAHQDIHQFRAQLRKLVSDGKIKDAFDLSKRRSQEDAAQADFESSLANALLEHAQSQTNLSPSVLEEVAQDSILQTKLKWEKGLTILATIGNNAPFIGLFGTVLGVIQAFHGLSQSAAGVQTVTAGISDALIATAVGILVAIPAVVAFNGFQRKVKAAIHEAEAFKSYLIGKLAK